ncbi:hypothetical protein ACVRY7_05290 [Streptococcus ictaluri]|uniref:CAAX amino terminal protease family protein n=1 Tax=Streptococcus ictaluri 707-05 TaxID=764299 RepID=G5K1W9_9STRE|nr:hypothetical protein [Streptococcus ictaluri]EHI70037.1 hypothetical protein STRIC_2377 [Streptococcus ictaluri 707-05]
MHYQAFEGNLYQCLVVTGIGRLPFTYLWFKTASLRGGIYAHICYDYFLFIAVLLFHFGH